MAMCSHHTAASQAHRRHKSHMPRRGAETGRIPPPYLQVLCYHLHLKPLTPASQVRHSQLSPHLNGDHAMAALHVCGTPRASTATLHAHPAPTRPRPAPPQPSHQSSPPIRESSCYPHQGPPFTRDVMLSPHCITSPPSPPALLPSRHHSPHPQPNHSPIHHCASQGPRPELVKVLHDAHP